MSSDNGIYIIKDKKGYRVAHCQAIDNIYWWNVNEELAQWKKKDKINPKEVDKKFGTDKYYKDSQEAFKEAIRLFDKSNAEGYFIEYGIQYLGEIE